MCELDFRDLCRVPDVSKLLVYQDERTQGNFGDILMTSCMLIGSILECLFFQKFFSIQLSKDFCHRIPKNRELYKLFICKFLILTLADFPVTSNRSHKLFESLVFVQCNCALVISGPKVASDEKQQTVFVLGGNNRTVQSNQNKYVLAPCLYTWYTYVLDRCHS